MNDQPSARWIRIAGASTLALGGFYLLWTVLDVSGAGLELTDEGFYLLWLRDPWVYTASATQFGFVYHGLYQLLDGSIELLRQINFLITFFLSVAFGFCLFRNLSPRERPWLHGLLAVGLAGTAFAFPASWIPTPSYNSLIMQAALLIGISFDLIRSAGTPARVVGGLLMGAGGVLAFQAKPTAAAALGLMALVFFITERRRALLPFLIAGASALVGLVLFALYIDGSVTVYAHRLPEGATIMRLLGANHSLGDLFRVDAFQTTPIENIVMGAMGLAGVLWLLTLHGRSRLPAFAGLGVTLFGIAFLILAQPGRAPEFSKEGVFAYLRLMPTLALPVAALLALAIQHLRGRPLPELRVSLIAGLLFLLFPFAAAFGTNNNTWGAASQHALFWIASALLLMRPLLPAKREVEAFVPVVALALVYVGVTVHLAIAAPYRQTASLDLADREIDLGHLGGRLRVTADLANYVEQSRALARKEGLADGAWILDFTGRSPGLTYILGGKTPGIPWWIGGYPGTTEMLTYAIKSVDCEVLLSAWLITEPGSPIALSPAILNSFGASVEDYEAMVQLNPPTGWGVPQLLMRPKPELGARLAACRELKSK